MASDFATRAAGSALDTVIKKTIELSVDQATRLYWLKKDPEWLSRELMRMQSFLNDIEARQFKGEGVANLVREIRDLAYDVEDIIDTQSLSRKLNSVSCCFQIGTHKLVMEIEGIKKRVADIERSRISYGISESESTTSNTGGDDWEARRTFSHVEEPNVVGIEEHVNKLRARLDNKDITSIIGMPGVGKTTIAKRIFKSIQEKFECSAWVYVSGNPNVEHLLQSIAKQVGLSEEEQKMDLEGNLYGFLAEHRYVIVLDDIWKIEAWDAFKMAIPINYQTQSRILLTSRNRDVGLYVGGSSSLYVVEPLNPENSWELFSKIVKMERTDEALLDIGRKILSRCAGLPLAIFVIGKLLIMKERTTRAWSGVLNEMVTEDDQCSRIVALSYRDLPSAIKPCFLYFGLFPEDRAIKVMEMIKVWAAEGFTQAKPHKTVEDVGEDYLTDLVNRSLIQVERRGYDGRIKSCRIHDVLHQFCISTGKDHKFCDSLIGDKSAFPLGTRRISVQNNFLPKGPQCPKLRAMFFFKKLDSPYLDFGFNFKLLRILHLERAFLGKNALNKIVDLNHLRYLHLGGRGPRSIPSSIRKLKNLQVLNVQNLPDTSILPIEICYLAQLRHLSIKSSATFQHSGKRTPFRGNQAQEMLPNLQSLIGLRCDHLGAGNIYQFNKLRALDLTGTVLQLARIFTDGKAISEKLEELALWVSPERNLVSPVLNLACYQNLSILKIIGPRGELPDFPLGLTKLTLLGGFLKKDAMEKLGRLPNLKKLNLRNNFYGGDSLVIEGHTYFPRLEALTIFNILLGYLKELMVMEEVMPNLKSLKLRFRGTLFIDLERLNRIRIEKWVTVEVMHHFPIECTDTDIPSSSNDDPSQPEMNYEANPKLGI